MANRLPITIKNLEKNEIVRSPGGLVSGMMTFLNKFRIKDYTWVGWAGASLKKKDVLKLQAKLFEDFRSLPIYVPERLMDKFYNGFCNKTIWPIFHNMPCFDG